MGKRKIQVVRRIREVYEFEIDEDYPGWEIKNKVQQSIDSGVLEEAKDFNLKLLDRTNLDTTYPIGGDYLDKQTHKENMLILDEFMRIWAEYPGESFRATLHELARTIHEEGDDIYESYLPADYREKYFTNVGTEEEPDYEEIEELWSERWDAEYDAIYLMIMNMENDEFLIWMRRLVEFIGY